MSKYMKVREYWMCLKKSQESHLVGAENEKYSRIRIEGQMVKGFEGQGERSVLILIDHRQPLKVLVQRSDISRPLI